MHPSLYMSTFGVYSVQYRVKVTGNGGKFHYWTAMILPSKSTYGSASAAFSYVVWIHYHDWLTSINVHWLFAWAQHHVMWLTVQGSPAWKFIDWVHFFPAKRRYLAERNQIQWWEQIACSPSILEWDILVTLLGGYPSFPVWEAGSPYTN